MTGDYPSERPKPDEELGDAWEYWHQRSIKLEALVHEAMRLHERARALTPNKKATTSAERNEEAAQNAWHDEARKVLRGTGHG